MAITAHRSPRYTVRSLRGLVYIPYDQKENRRLELSDDTIHLLGSCVYVHE